MPAEWTGEYYPRKVGLINTTLEWAKSAFLHRHVIDDLLEYFQTGKLEVPQNFNSPLPRFVHAGLLDINSQLLAIRGIVKSPNPLIPFINEAYVTFAQVDRQEDVSPYEIINDSSGRYIGEGHISTYFTSFLTASENLANFTQDFLSPDPEIHRAPGESMEELMAKQYDELLKNP